MSLLERADATDRTAVTLFLTGEPLLSRGSDIDHAPAVATGELIVILASHSGIDRPTMGGRTGTQSH